MTITVLRISVLECDHPDCEATFELGAGDKAAVVRAAAAQEGWGKTPDPYGADLCPEHRLDKPGV